MQNCKLIVSDLDGTLLDDNMNVSADNLTAIKKFKEMGIEFSVSSGRTFYEIPASVRDNPNIRYIAYSNGSVIYDREKGVNIVSNYLSTECVNKALDVITEYSVFYAVHAGGRTYRQDCQPECDFRFYQINAYYEELFLSYDRVEDIEKFTRKRDDVESIVLFFHDDRELDECMQRIDKMTEITFTSSIKHNIELCSSYAGKGTALKALRETLCLPKESVIAVGDNQNDISMLKEAGLAISLENGLEEAKKFADKVICSNNDSIADYILKNIIYRNS